jgi:hypothetical protein
MMNEVSETVLFLLISAVIINRCGMCYAHAVQGGFPMIGMPRPRSLALRALALALLALGSIPPAATGLGAHEARKIRAGSAPGQTQLAQSIREADPECYCWANGRRFAHGEQACIKGAGATRLATCDRVINMMSWSFSAEPCPES